MLRVGVIGLGSMGKIHLRNYCEMAQAQVVGAVDLAAANREAAEKQFGVRAFDSVAALLAEGVDAVSISVPTSLHFEVAMQVIAAGVSLLVEKPLAATSEQGRQIVRAARERGVTLMVGHIERFNPAVVALKPLLAQGLVSVAIERSGPFPARIQDVGVVKDLSSHDIDLAAYLAGSEFATVAGACANGLPSAHAHEDCAVIVGRMKNGVVASVANNWVTPFRVRTIRAACADRYYEADLITLTLREYGAFDPQAKTYTVREHPTVRREQMREELTAFLAAVQGKTEPPITGEDGLIVLEVIEKVLGE